MPRHSVKDQLLVAGRDLIHRRGFAASGVAEITAAAGVPKGSFYNHFPSKEAFALAALESYWAQGAPAMDVLTGPGPTLAKVRRHFEAIGGSLAADSYQSGCLLGNLAIEACSISEPVRKRAAAFFGTWTAALAECLAQGQAAGEVTATIAPETLARFLIGAWEGAVQRAKVERDRRALDAFQAVLPRLLAP